MHDQQPAEEEEKEEKERSPLPRILDSTRCSRARFAHASLSVPSGTAGLLPAKWTIRNDTGGCHFSAKCRALSAGDDSSRLYIFFSLSLPLSHTPVLLFSLARPHGECFGRKSCGDFSSVIPRVDVCTMHSCCIRAMRNFVRKRHQVALAKFPSNFYAFVSGSLIASLRSEEQVSHCRHSLDNLHLTYTQVLEVTNHESETKLSDIKITDFNRYIESSVSSVAILILDSSSATPKASLHFCAH